MSINELTQYNEVARELPLDISIVINGKVTQLALLKKLRILPGRRLVARAQWCGKNVLVKLFIGKKGRRDYQNELAGVRALKDGKIYTPELLAVGVTTDDEASLLLFEYIDGAVSLADILAKHENYAAVEIINKAIDVVSEHHQNGLQQVDIHLDNFLIKDDIIYTIDGASIDSKHFGKSLPPKKRLENLSLFFAQLNTEYDFYINDFLSNYNVKTKSSFKINNVNIAINHYRQKRLSHFLSKIYRNCSQFICRQSWGEYRVCLRSWASEAMQQWLDDIDTHVQVCITADQIKKGNTTTVVRVKQNNGYLIIKRYNIKGVWHALSRCWRPSRAWVAWRNAHILLFLGIPTPLPLALIENRMGFLRRGAYLVTDAIEGVSLEKIENSHNLQWVASVGAIFKQMAAAKISHGDLKATNFMMKDDQAYLIDLDTMKQHHVAWFFRRAFAKDIERFMRNWDQRPDIKVAFEAELKSVM